MDGFAVWAGLVGLGLAGLLDDSHGKWVFLTYRAFWEMVFTNSVSYGGVGSWVFYIGLISPRKQHN